MGTRIFALGVFGACAILVAATIAGQPRQSSVAPPSSPEPAIFTDVTAQAGITWRQSDGESQDRFLIETMGGGVAFFDFNGDGLLDLFFVNGGETPHGKSAAPLRNALYQNLGDGKFADVTGKSGLASVPFYGMGVAAADYDNDGFEDLYITGYPSSALFHNNGDGTFTNVTNRAGVNNSGRWGAGAAWFDFDRDGYLDLIVTNYAKFSFDDPKKCEVNGVRAYCAQKAYQGMPLALFHNNRNGTFTDVSQSSGLSTQIGRGLGVVAVDVNGDGWTDLFVARDASPNLLLINQRNGTFRDVALEAEVAYDMSGEAKAGMGVDVGDVNGDGQPDFAIANFNDQYFSLFVSSPSVLYEDKTVAAGLASATSSYVGWGTKFIDFDNDGNLDLIFANGHINRAIESMRTDVKYKQPPLLLHNDGRGDFQKASAGGTVFENGLSARGLAVGDYDNDGDTDVVLTRLNETPILLRNNVGQNHAWVGLFLHGTKSNLDAIGARVTLEAGRRKLVRWVTGGSSYLSSHDNRVLFGLGTISADVPVRVEIRWPSGFTQTVSNLSRNTYSTVVEATDAMSAH